MPSESPTKIFRVFVASPGDVAQEREIAFGVIDDFNETWGKSVTSQIHLELLSWEGVPPTPGKSQEVINHWIPVESSDIFIAIMWKRFGMPPEINRPQDNKPYLSGTQVEIETAYESWKTSGYPHFMLYWKQDDLSIDMTSDEVEQLKIVKNYLRKFESDGEYPALYKRFRKNKFKQTLMKDLVQVTNELVKARTQEIMVDTTGLGDSVPKIDDDRGRQPGSTVEALSEDIEQMKWLNKVQLKDNPFRYQHAEYDKSLPLYFTRFPGLNTVNADDLTQERKSWFFFGKDGSGKTALRNFIAARGRPKRQDSDMVCIEYDQVEFEKLLINTGDISDFPFSFVQSIFSAISPYTRNAIPSPKPADGLRANLTNLSVELRKSGIKWVLCLFDPGRATFEWKGSQVSTSALITPLFSLSEVGGYGFRYFLPASMKEELKPTFKRLPFNYIRVMDIQWDEKTLKDMLGKRMTLLSIDQTAPYRSLGQLCEDKQNLSTLIDSEIAGFAQGNPRAAIWLANRLIEQHCEEYPTPPRIAPEIWEKVKQAWREQGESRILGTSGSSGFRVLSGRSYYQNREIILPERSDRLLKALILAKGGFCSKQELVETGWIGEKNLEVISDKTLSEALRRMKEEVKKELKDKGFDTFNCFKSVRGRGYRLVQPGIVQNMQEGKDD